MKASEEMSKQNFLRTYQSQIMPKIKELDLIMKEGGYNIDIARLANAISASEAEITEILLQMGEHSPTKDNIFDIIARCKSGICRMIMRECRCGSPEKYTSFQIAYIYGLKGADVADTFDLLNIKKAKPSDLYSIFANIN